MEKYLREREAAFEVLMSLIKQYCDEAVPVLRGLDNVQERLTINPRLHRVLNPASSFEICPLLNTLLVVLPHLMQSEVKSVNFESSVFEILTGLEIVGISDWKVWKLPITG